MHYVVNHIRDFLDSDTYIHNNTIEGIWSAIKMMIEKLQNEKPNEDFLKLFMWKEESTIIYLSI